MLRAFFDSVPEPPLVPLLLHFSRELRVVPHRVAPSSGVEPVDDDDVAPRMTALLGAGGSARVFCVRVEGDDSLYALKASTALSRSDLEYEFTTLQRAAEAGSPVVPVVSGSLIVYTDDSGAHCGGGFLLRDVCARAVLDSGARCAAAFASLRALHAAGFAHGDARLPNLVVRGHGADAEFLWIDLRAAAAGALESMQRTDALSFAASVLGIQQGGALPAPFDSLLACIPSGGNAAYAALAAAVWGTFMRV